jgi:hypothetical protein
MSDFDEALARLNLSNAPPATLDEQSDEQRALETNHDQNADNLLAILLP